MPRVEANVIASLLVSENISRHWAPRELLCARGITFLSKVVHFVKYFKFKRSILPVIIQRQLVLHKDLILTYVSLCRCVSVKDWDEFIPPILFALRTSISEAIGDSPF